MNIKILSFSVGFLLNIGTIAQFDFNPNDILKMLDSPVESDRPGQALSSTTCGIATVQLQTGLNYAKFNQGIDNNQEIWTSATQLRFGFTKKFELNVGFSYSKINESTFIGPLTNKGFTSPEVGFRYAFMKGNGWKPNLALQSSLTILSHRGDFRQQNFGSVYYLISSNQFSKISINSNLGLRFAGDDLKSLTLPYVLNFGFNLGDKMSCFIEAFGSLATFSQSSIITNTMPTIGSDLGIAYSPISALQIDVYGGVSEININSAALPWFIELGFTWKYSVLKAIAKKKIKDFQGVFGN